MKFAHSKPVVVVPYKPEWQQEFMLYAEKIKQVVGDTAIRIDHIGSTSVPGLAAKDIIDIQITVADIDDVEDFINRMLSAGFRQRGDIRYDELTGCEASQQHELRKLYFREPAGSRRVHIHVRNQGYLNQRYALLFRDYLRDNGQVRHSYELLKIRLAELFPSQIDGYLFIKDPLMDIIFCGAQSWAKTINWKLPSD